RGAGEGTPGVGYGAGEQPRPFTGAPPPPASPPLSTTRPNPFRLSRFIDGRTGSSASTSMTQATPTARARHAREGAGAPPAQPRPPYALALLAGALVFALYAITLGPS